MWAFVGGGDDTGDDDTSTTCSVRLVRTAGGVRFAGVLGKTGKAQSIGTGDTFLAMGEGKLSGRVSTFPRPGNMWSTYTVRCL